MKKDQNKSYGNSGEGNPKIKIYDPQEDVAKKFDFYIKIVVCVLGVAMITMIIMTATLVIDSFHINSATYREYTRTIKEHNELIQKDTDNQQNIIDSIDEIKEEVRKIKETISPKS